MLPMEDSIEYQKLPTHWRIHILFLFGTILTPIGVAFLLVEIRIQWYLYSLGIQRHELSESYGLGFEVLLLTTISILISVPLVVFFWWFMVYRKKNKAKSSRSLNLLDC